jgi:hypothetical protein
MTQSARRTVAVLKAPKSVPALITYARAILTAMTGNPRFPNPSPQLADVKRSTDDLEVSEAAARARTRGAAGLRNEKRTALVAKLDLLKDCVQIAVDADPLNAAGIIASATMSIRKVPSRTKKVFAVKPGPVAGSLKVSTPSAGPRVSYDWQSSADGGKTWTLLPTTLQARTTVTGLAVGARYSFRYRVVTKSGVGDWTNPVAITLR